MKESKLYTEYQRLGKELMAPVLLLPVSGILHRQNGKFMV